MSSVDLAALDEAALTDWLLERRWFGSKARDVAQLNVLDVVPIHDGPPGLASALVEARFPGGTHDVYQLLLGMRVGGTGIDDAVVAEVGGVTVYDAVLVLKAFRRVEAGDNPELEMLRFLSGRGFPNIAPLGGWYQYEGELM